MVEIIKWLQGATRKLFHNEREPVEVEKKLTVIAGVTSPTDGTIEPFTANDLGYFKTDFGASSLVTSGEIHMVTGPPLPATVTQTAAGDTDISLPGAASNVFLVTVIAYTEAGAATPTITISDASGALLTPVTVTASTTTTILGANGPLVFLGATDIVIGGGAAGDTWQVNYYQVR
jgi:hypothetical protein